MQSGELASEGAGGGRPPPCSQCMCWHAPPFCRKLADCCLPLGNNSQPRGLTVSYNVMQNIGRVLIHVAGVAFRAASDSVVAHNRIHKTPRYGLQADSFYATPPPDGSGAAGSGLISSGNVFEYNIISETNRYTTDTGAIEMLGSGDPGLIGWWNNKCVRACVPQY